MVNFCDPAMLARDFSVTVKLWHAFAGLYFWEFFTTLGYEWNVIRGRRRYLWTIYSLTRVAALVAIVLTIAGVNVNDRHACRAWTTGSIVFVNLALAAASSLIVLRVVSIWNRRPVIMAIAIGVWGINVFFLVLGAWMLRPTWIPVMDTCGTSNIQSNKLTVVSIFVTDVILLLIMLLGLLRLRFDGGGLLHIGSFLWKQGIIWLTLAATAEVPPVVFISLNLNDVLSTMFHFPAFVTMSIAATRIYRSLAEYVFDFTDFAQDRNQGSGPPVLTTMQAHVAHISLNGMAAAVRTASAQYPTSSRSTSHLGSSIDTDWQRSFKPSELTSEDPEKGVDN